MPHPSQQSAAQPVQLVAREHGTETGLFYVLAEALDVSDETWVLDTPRIANGLRTQLSSLTKDLPASADREWKMSLTDIGVELAQGRVPLAKGLAALAGGFDVAGTDRLVDLPATATGAPDAGDGQTPARSSPAPSIKVRLSTTFCLRVLDLLAQRLEAYPEESLNAHGKAATLRLFRSALISGLDGSPFLIDIDQLRRDLAQVDAPAAEVTARVESLRKHYLALAELARQGVIGKIQLVSNAPVVRGEPGWTRLDSSRWSSSSDAPLRTLLPDLRGLPTPRTAEDVLSALFQTLRVDKDRWQLSRLDGRLRIDSALPHNTGTRIYFAPATEETVLAQNELLLTLARLLRLTGLGAASPYRWPESMRIDENQFKAGQLVLARADRAGRWTVDQEAVHRLFSDVVDVHEPPVRAGPVGHWSDRIPLPATLETLTSSEEPPEVLRLFVALENDETADQMGLHFLRQYRDRGGLVWIRMAQDRSWTVRMGQSLLEGRGAGAKARRVQLIVDGHGTLDPAWKSMRLAGYDPHQLAKVIGHLFLQLQQAYPGLMTEIDHTRLTGCGLESPAVDGSFGAAFAKAADWQGWARPGMRTTVYAQQVGIYRHADHPEPTVFGSSAGEHAAPVRHAAGVTWEYWVDGGQVERADKYPQGGTGLALAADDDIVMHLKGRRTGAGGASSSASTSSRPRTTEQANARLGAALGQIAQRLYRSGLEARHAYSDATSARLSEAAAKVVTGTLQGSAVAFDEAYDALLAAFTAPDLTATEAQTRARAALAELKDNVLGLLLAPVVGTPAYPPSTDAGRAAVIALTLDQLTATWPDDAALPASLRSDLHRALDALPLPTLQTRLMPDTRRQLSTRMLDAILDERPWEMGQVYLALLKAEHQYGRESGAGTRATRSFQALVDEAGALLVGHSQAIAQTRTVRGRELAAFLGEALEASGPARPFTVRLHLLGQARQPGSHRELRIQAGLRLAALDRLRLLSATGVLGPLRFVADPIFAGAHADDAPWTRLADGGFETSVADAARLLGGLYFDPVDERVARLRDGVLIDALSRPWKRFVRSIPLDAAPSGSPAAQARVRLSGFAQAIVDEIVGLAARPPQERQILMSPQAWERRQSEMTALLASLRADPAVTQQALEDAGRLEQLMTDDRIDRDLSGWVRKSALGLHALSPVTELRPLPLLGALATGMTQHLDRGNGVVELTVPGDVTRVWHVPALRDPLDVAARTRQDQALRDIDIWMAGAQMRDDSGTLDRLPSQLRYTVGALEVDGRLVARAVPIDESVVAGSLVPPSQAWRPMWESSANSTDTDTDTASESGAGTGADTEASTSTSTKAGPPPRTVSGDPAVAGDRDAGPARSRWSPAPTGALTIEQRASAIAAAFQTETADWGMALPEADALRAHLLPALRQAAGAKSNVLPATSVDAGAAPLLDGLITGSPLRLRDAYLALLDAIDPSRRRTSDHLAEASRQFAALKRLAWDGIASVNAQYRAATSQALADLYLAAIGAAPGRPLKLRRDEMDFSPKDNRPRSRDAAAGVTMALYERLRQLDRAGLIGTVLWTSSKRHSGSEWVPSGTEFESTGDMHAMRARWHFDPVAGLQPLVRPALPAPTPIDDARPLRTLAALFPGLRQTLDRQAGTVRLAWTSGGVRGYALVLLLPTRTDGDAPHLEERLAQLDLMLSAHVARTGTADLNALPARLSFTATELSEPGQVIARLSPSGWTFAAADTGASGSGVRPALPDGIGRVQVISALLAGAVANWSEPQGWTDAEKEALVDAFGVRPFQEPPGKDSRTLKMRPVAETLLAGILESSVPTLRRAYDLMLRWVDASTAPEVAHREATQVLRLLIDHAESFLAEQPADAQATTRSLPGRTLARFFADLLTSATEDAPLLLDFESLRTALERHYARDPAATRYAGLVLAMRDQLHLMAATGVIGPVRHVATYVPSNDIGTGWTQDGRRWVTDRDMIAESWPTAVVDPVSGTIETLRRKDLAAPWEDFADELASQVFKGKPSQSAANELDQQADAIAEELGDLAGKPVADRSVGMSAAAWRRRVAETQALRDRIHNDNRINDAVRDYADRLVAIAESAATQAATPSHQAAFGRGTMPAVDEAVPLPMFRQIAPDVAQRLDRAAGTIRLTEGGVSAVWRLPPAAPGDTAAQWQLDEALRSVDALITRVSASRAPLPLAALPLDLTYAAGELRSGDGLLLARRLARPSTDQAGHLPPLTGSGGSGTDGDVSATDSQSSAKPATPLLERKLVNWRDELTAGRRASAAWQSLKDGLTARPRPGKQHLQVMQMVVLQMDDSPQAFEASLRHAARAKHRDAVLWLQADRLGEDRIAAGGELIGTTWSGDRIKLVIVGRGSQDAAGLPRLSGYDGKALSARVDQVLDRQLGDRRPVFGKVTLLACDLAGDLSRPGFVPDFVAGFQPTQDYDVTAFKGQLVFPADDPTDERLTRRWTVGEGAIRALHHAAEGAYVTRHVAGVGPQAPTPKHANDAPTVLPTADTIAAFDTALDDGPAQARRLLASIEEAFALFDPALDGKPPAVLQALFDEDSEPWTDASRLLRIASDPLEQDQLLRDLRERLATTDPSRIDAGSLGRWTQESLAGRYVLESPGHELSASFLHALGARISGKSLPELLAEGGFHNGRTEAAMYGDMRLDSRLFERVLPRLPDDAGSWRRLLGVVNWLQAQADRGKPLFFNPASPDATAMAHRLSNAVVGRDVTNAATLATVLAAIRGKEVTVSQAGTRGDGVADSHAAAPEYGLVDVLHEALAHTVPDDAPAPSTPEALRLRVGARDQLLRRLATAWPEVDQAPLRQALTVACDELLAGKAGPGLAALRSAVRRVGLATATVALPEGPFGDVERLRIDEAVRSTFLSTRSIRRSTRLYLDILEGMATLIEANPPFAPTSWRTAAALRWMRAAMASGLGGTPFLIDIDRLRHDLAASASAHPSAAAAARLEAFRRCYPALKELAREGTVGPIRFISSDAARRGEAAWTPLDARWSSTGEDQAQPLMPDLAPPPAGPSGEQALQEIFSGRPHRLVREQGLLWLHRDAPGSGRTLVHYARPPQGSPERLAGQEASLRTLARMLRLTGLTADTVDGWPDTLRLLPDEFRVGDQVLARAGEDGRWTVQRGTVARLLAGFDRPRPTRSSDGVTPTLGSLLDDSEVYPMEDLLEDATNLKAWEMYFGRVAAGRAGGPVTGAPDPVPERGLIDYLHEALAPQGPDGFASASADEGGRPPPARLGAMYNRLFFRWKAWLDRRMVRTLQRATNAILDGGFPNVHKAILGALVHGNPPLPADEGLPVSTPRLRVSGGMSIDFLDQMAEAIEDTPASTAKLLEHAALLRLMGKAIASGHGRAPFLIDIDQVQQDLADPTPVGTGRIDALTRSYRLLAELARQGVIGQIRFTSRDASRAANPRWTRLDEQRYSTGDDLLPQQIRHLAPLPPAPSAEQALGTLLGQGRFTLDRAAGTLRVGAEVAGQRHTAIRFDPLPNDASPERRATQERQLLTLARLLRLSGLADLPTRQWPAELSIGQDGFKAGSLVVARADASGRWTIDDPAQRRLLSVVSRARAADAPTGGHALTWKNHVDLSDEPAPAGRTTAASSDPHPAGAEDVLRIYVALEDDPAIDRIGAALYRSYAKNVVLVRLARDFSWAVRHGQALLDDAVLGKRPVRLILGGHGRLDPATKAMVLAGQTPEQIAVSVGQLLRALRPDAVTSVERTRILACSLESPAARGSFGGAFAKAADTAGWAAPRMRTTTYADLVVLQLLSDDRAPAGDQFFTRIDAEGPDVRRAADATWQHWVEDGKVRSEDKYPGGGPGEPVGNEARRVLLADRGEATGSGRNGDSARTPLLPPEARAAEAARVRQALAVLAQVPAEVLPRWAMMRSTDTRLMSERVLHILLARMQSRPPLGAVLQQVSDDLVQGLLGDAAQLRHAYDRLCDLDIHEEFAMAAGRSWLARAISTDATMEVVPRLGGNPARITRASHAFIGALDAVLRELSPNGQPRPGTELSRVVGRTILLQAAMGAAATNGVIYVDLSDMPEPRGQGAMRDAALYHSRAALLHLQDLGVVREVTALSIGAPGAGLPRTPGQWRSAGEFPVGGEIAAGQRLHVAVAVSPLTEGMITSAMPHLAADGDGTLEPLSKDTIRELVERLTTPLSEALHRLKTLLEEHGSTQDSPSDSALLELLIKDVEERLARLKWRTGEVWSFNDFHREILTPAEITPLSPDPVDLQALLRGRPELHQPGSDRQHAALDLHRQATQRVAEALSRILTAWGRYRPADSPEFLPLLPDDQPFPALQHRARNVRQSLDRATGLIRLEHPRTDIVTEVRVDPLATYSSDGASPRTAMVRQDADIRIAESLIARWFQPAHPRFLDHPEALGELPRHFSLRGGEFSVNAQIVARRRAAASDAISGIDQWEVDTDGLTSARRSLRPLPATDFLVEPWQYGLVIPPEPVIDGPPERLKVILQLAGDADSTTAAGLLARKHEGRAAWLQLATEPNGQRRIVRAYGRSLLQAADASTVVDVLVVGHSGMVLAQDQTVSGWTPRDLAWRIVRLFDLVDAGAPAPRTPAGTPRLRRVSLVACDTQAPSVDPSFADRFIRALGEYGGWAGQADVTARTGHVHVTEFDDGVDGDSTGRIMKLTAREDAAGQVMLRHRLPGDTMLLRLDPDSGVVTVTDKYADPVEDSALQWQRPAEDLKVWFDSVLRDTVPTSLIRLFTDARGQVDEDRMRRVAGDPDEVRQLADDLATAFASVPEAERAAMQPHDLLARSSAGRVTVLDGREVPMKDLRARVTDAGTDLLRDERVLDDLVRRTLDEDTLGLDAVSRTTAREALGALRKSGLVTVDADGVARLVEAPLQALVAGSDDAALMRAGAWLLHLPDEVFESLRAGAGPAGQRLLDKAREVRQGFAGSLGEQAADGVTGEAAAGHAVGLLNTVIATVQLVQGWRHMDPTMKGLLVTQTGSVVITPLVAKVGQWLRGLSSTLSAGANTATILEKSLATIGTALEGGAADIGLAGLGLVVVGLQWDEFRKSGQGTDSFAFKSLVANTTVMTFFTATSLVSAGVQLSAAFAGGAEAIAGTALGLAAGVVAEAALPLALLMIAINGVVGSFLWLDEYGDYIRPSTHLGDLIGASVAKFFGIETDVFKRAEIEKGASGAARARMKMLDQARTDLMAFRGEQLATSGYGTVKYPTLTHQVDHATFRVPSLDSDYTFVLQDAGAVPATVAPGQDGFDRWDSPTPDVGVAWLDLVSRPGFRIQAPTGATRQRFELQGARGRTQGGAGQDVFLLDADSRGDIDGQGGADEVDLDAQGGHVSLHHDSVMDGLALVVGDGQRLQGTQVNGYLKNIEGATIRNAVHAEVTGGPGDERFDVAARQTDIAGGGGRNTYVLREGNRIRSSSDDALIWPVGVNAFVDVEGSGSLLLKVDVPHEDLVFSLRHGDRLVVGTSDGKTGGTLTLEGFFRPTKASSAARMPSLFIVDALGTHLTLLDPGRLDEAERASAVLDKHLYFDASTPKSRRALTGDHGHTRHHLASGGGDFLLRPRTSMPMDVTLDVPLERLRYRREGDNLLILETPPADAPSGFTPLRLSLPGYGRRDWAASHGQLALWARAGTGKDERPATKLRHPAPDDPDEGPVSGAAPDAPLEGPALTKTPSDAQPTVLTGTEGADTYDVVTEVAAGRHVVIDNQAAGAKRDFLKLPSVRRLRRVGDDLVIESDEGGSVTLRRHATDALARHLSMIVSGKRLALPVIHESGVMVYGDDAADGAILATLPGVHVVLTPTDAAWRQSPPRRDVLLSRGARLSRIGRSVQVASDRDGSRTLFKDILQAPHLAREIVPEGLPESRDRGFAVQDVVDATWRTAVERLERSAGRVSPFLAAALDARGIRDETLARGVDALWRSIHRGKADPGEAHPVDAVREFLRMGGLPGYVAADISATTLGQVRRIRALLEAFVDGKAWPSATLLNEFAGSASTLALSARRHGAMLRHLSALKRPWAYQEAVLAAELTPQALDAFEAWAAKRLTGVARDQDSLHALREFIRLLSGKPEADAVITHNTKELLRIALKVKGRPDDVADQLADAMVSVTLDEAWIDGMLRAGVVDHTVLKRLWEEGLSVRDLLMSNANRLAYEGMGNRAGLIEVGTSQALRTRDTTVPRYVVNDYLLLDDNGDDFTAHREPRGGVAYDLVPGTVLDAAGNAPEALTPRERAQLVRSLRAAFDRKWDEIDARLSAWETMGRGPLGPLGKPFKSKREAAWPAALSAGLTKRSSLHALVEKGLVTVTRETFPGSLGYGRSTPSNLLDGVVSAREATAWRPPAALGTLPLSPGERGEHRAIQFDFAHPVALSTLTLHLRQDAGLDANRRAKGRWRIDGRNRRDEWIPVSDVFELDAKWTPGWKQLFLDDSIPYRHYRLVGIDGELSPGTWFSEVTFTTAEVGAPTWRDRFQRLGYDLHRARVLIASGYATEEGLARAGALPARFRQATDGELYLAMRDGARQEAARRSTAVSVMTQAMAASVPSSIGIGLTTVTPPPPFPSLAAGTA